jgi:site-specific DNA recombinase
MAIYGYARVSTTEQAEEYDALKQQIKRLEDAGAETVLVDIESGRSDKREQFNKLLKLVTQGKVREIIITRIDRLGRSVLTLGKTLKLFEDNNVKLRILDQPVDANSIHGWFSLHTMSGMAEFESRMLSQRTRHGMEYFRSQGKLQKATFGYRLNSDYKLEIDPEAFPVARAIVDKLLEGYSFGAVSKYIFETYNIKLSLSGLRHWIKTPIILGHTRYFTEKEHRRNPKNPRPPKIIHNTHEAIATEAEVSQIIGNIKTKPRLSSKVEKNYPLKGLLRCACCGGGMHRIISKYKSGETHWIRCSKHCQNTHFCHNKKNARLTTLIQQVIGKITERAEIILTETNIVDASEKESETLLKLRSELIALESIREPSDFILTAINNLRISISLEEAQGVQTKVADAQSWEKLQSFSQAIFWESLDEDKLGLVFRYCIEAVFVDESGNVASIDFCL